MALAAPQFHIPGVWRGVREADPAPVSSTGFRELDDALLGGWPQGSLVQISGAEEGLGLSLLIPSFAKLTQDGRYIALVRTPHLPFAPALASRGVKLERLLWVQPEDETGALWALEQMTRSGLIAATAYWGPRLDGTTERRLQLAATEGKCLAFCFHASRRDEHSYAAVRLCVSASANANISIEVQKCRGRNPGQRLSQPCDEAIQAYAS